MQIERVLPCVLLLLLVSPTGGPMLAQAPAATGNGTRSSARSPIRRRSRATMQRLSARPHHVGSPYDKDNAEWILAQVQGVGLGRADRDASTCSSPRRRSASLELVGADAVHGEARRAGGRRRSHVEPEERAAADLQRLLDRRRRDRRRSSTSTTASRTTTRQLERLRRLREGRDRHRALRRSRGAASSRRSPPSTARSAA